MATKYELITELADVTAKRISSDREEWTRYLKTAARLYRYPFREQMLIYAQRPDATAVASMEIWNNRMNCWVNRGAKEHLDKAKNPKLYATDHADQLSAYDTALTTLELNKVPADLVSSDYIGELQKFLQTYEAEAAEIEQRIAENDQMIKEFVKVQRELNAYHNISDEI